MATLFSNRLVIKTLDLKNMGTIDIGNENYVEAMARMETSLQDAMMRAMTMRENQLTISYQTITTLQKQIQDQTLLLGDKNQLIDNLKKTISELNFKLDKCQTQNELLKEELIRCGDGIAEQLKAKDKEMELMRGRHMEAVQTLTTDTREIIIELEKKLDLAAAKEEEYRQEINDLTESKHIYEKKLADWNSVSEKMCTELSETKNKLQSTRYANQKIREELTLWKKYCDKAEEERKAIKREIDLENRVHKKLSQLDVYFKNKDEQQNKVLAAINSLGNEVSNKIERKLEDFKPRNSMMSIPTQTDELKQNHTLSAGMMSVSNFVAREKVRQLEEELKKCDSEIEDLQQQNLTLREVIKSMKKEKVDWERKKEEMEEESKVSKLEESVKLLKTNFMAQQKDVCVWDALREVKTQVETLKMKNMPQSKVKDREKENGIFRVLEVKNKPTFQPRYMKI